MFLFCLLDDRIASPISVCLFFWREKLLATTETTVTWTRRISWFVTWPHEPCKNPDPFLHWLTVNFIVRGWSGNLKARSQSIKISEFIFFVRLPFCTFKSYHNYRNPVGCIDTWTKHEEPDTEQIGRVWEWFRPAGWSSRGTLFSPGSSVPNNLPPVRTSCPTPGNIKPLFKNIHPKYFPLLIGYNL